MKSKNYNMDMERKSWKNRMGSLVLIDSIGDLNKE